MKRTDFVDPTKLTNQVMLWLRINQVFALVGLLVWLLVFLLVFYIESSPSIAADTTHMIAVSIRLGVGVFFILLMTAFLISLVYTLHWVHQANRNVRQLGVEGMKFTPAAAVCWFFVPIANLYFVPKMMNEIWKTSKNPTAWQQEPDEPLVSRWWWFWVIGCACSSFANGLYKHDMTSEQLILPTILQVITGTCVIISALALIAIIKEITAMQLSHYEANKPGIVSS